MAVDDDGDVRGQIGEMNDSRSIGPVNRNSHLDLLRALAIGMVVAYHVLQMCPQPLPEIMRIAHYGQYGVDLFFVLSGWLIGGLYWNERVRFGGVQLGRFWLRRWLRTIPPYLAALALSWLAVFIQWRKPLDLGYLVFIQNYYEKIPYFLVSWSLCIEEHFYLLMPLLLLVFKVHGGRVVFVVFSLLVLLAPACRWALSLDGIDTAFGYEQTATHLRMEGLLLGFWLAHEQVNSPQRWGILKRMSPWVLAVAAATLIALQFVAEVWMYRLGLTVLAVGLAAMLVLLVERKVGRFTTAHWVRAVAQASFSVYLTHPLMIHVARKFMAMFQYIPWQGYFPVVFLLIVLAGAAFYFCVECTSIFLRDLWVPRRTFSTTELS